MAVQCVDNKEQDSLTNLLQPVWANVKNGIESLQLFSTSLQLPSSSTKYLQDLSTQAYQYIHKAEKELKKIKEHKQTEAYQGILKRKEIEDKIKECEGKLSCLKTDCSIEEDKIEQKKYKIQRQQNTIYEEEQKLARIRDEFATQCTAGILKNAVTGILSLCTVAAIGVLAAPVVIPLQIGIGKLTCDEVQKLEEELKCSRQELSWYKTQLENHETDLRTIKQKLLSLQREDDKNRKTLSDLKHHQDIVLDQIKKVTELCGYMSRFCSFLLITGGRFQILMENRKEPIFATNVKLILAQIMNLFSNTYHIGLAENTPLDFMLKGLTFTIADFETIENCLDKPYLEDMETTGKVIKALNSGDERRKMAIKQMEIESSWCHMIYPAPTAIAVLGMLMAISTKNDFSFKNNAPKKGFKHAKYASSFRASLVQISDDGYNSFTTAHSNMDKIYLTTMQLEKNVRRLVLILLRGTEQEKAELTPIFLNEMRKNGKSCLSLAEEVRGSFQRLTLLVQEISQAAAGAKGVHETVIKKCEDQKRILKKTEDEIKKKKDDMNKEYKKITENVSKAKSALDKEFENLPSTGKIMLLSVIDTLTNIASVPGAIIQVGFDKLHSPSGAGDQKTKEQMLQEQKAMSIAFENATQIFCMIEFICSIVQNEKNLGESFSKEEGGIFSDENIKDKTYIKEQLNAFIAYLDKFPFSTERVVVACRSLCKRGIAICEALMTESLYQRDKSLDRLSEEAKKLLGNAEEFKIKADRFLSPGSLSDTMNVTNQSKSSLNSKSALEAENEKVMTKIKAKEKEYDRIRNKAETQLKEIKEMDMKYGKVLRDMCNLDITKINFDEILKTLNKGIEALSELKQQWGKLVDFFIWITNRVKICLNGETQQLDQLARRQGCKKQLILEIAANINAFSCAAGQIAKSYTDISSKHLMSNMAGLSRMIAYDPEKEEGQLKERKKELLSECETAKQDITMLVEERHRQTLQEIDAIFVHFSHLEQQLLPINDDRMREIERMSQDSDNTEFNNIDDFLPTSTF